MEPERLFRQDGHVQPRCFCQMPWYGLINIPQHLSSTALRTHECKPSINSKWFYHFQIRKSKFNPRTSHEVPEGEKRQSSTLSLTSALDGGGWLTPRTGRIASGNDPVPVVEEAGRAVVAVWTTAENLANIGTRSPDPATHSDILYRLSYPGPLYYYYYYYMNKRMVLYITSN
jgi:hypothetical protein